MVTPVAFLQVLSTSILLKGKIFTQPSTKTQFLQQKVIGTVITSKKKDQVNLLQYWHKFALSEGFKIFNYILNI